MLTGSYRLGENAPLIVSTVNGIGVPTVPTNPPVARVMSGTTLIETFSMPLSPDTSVTGLFTRDLFLGSAYATGVIDVSYKWTISSVDYQALQRFEIVAGGDTKGAVTTVVPYFRPDAQLLVHSTNAGQLLAARNPR